MSTVLEEIKAENEALLVSWGVDVNRNLPLIEDESEVSPRTANDVAARICALGYVVSLGFRTPAADLRDKLKRFDLWRAVSEQEKRLLEADRIDEQDRINCTWLQEGIQALMWVIGRAELRHDRKCDDGLASRIPFQVDPTHFILSARLRPLPEIQRQCDLLYRLHWYARNCRLDGKECAFQEGLVWEHRRAIDWAYGVEEEWDEVPGDT